MDLHIQDTRGDGRPVILIHGWPLSSEGWEPQIPVLSAAGYRVIAYDRRGFGQSDKPGEGYDYDTLTADLHKLMEDHDLRDVTLVGFSMGGGEVARYIPNHGSDRIRSLVFAAAVPPYLMKGDDNPDGPLDQATAEEFEKNLRADRDAFFDGFTKDFYTAGDDLLVGDDVLQTAKGLCQQSSETAALACMEAWATTDFRDDLTKIDVPCLVLHGTADGVVPIEGSGHRTHKALSDSSLVELDGAPHGCNVTHADTFNKALLNFLKD
ncbi:MAG: alpha/beta fold hydrolase [Shimia sp.]